MKKTLSIAKRIILQVGMDKRTLALILFAPILIMTLMWVIINSAISHPRIAVFDAAEAVILELEKSADLITAANSEDGVALVKSGKADAFVDFSAKPVTMTLDGADPGVSAAVGTVFQKAMMQMISNMPFISSRADQLKPELRFLYGSEYSDAFDFIAPLMMGFVIFFLIFILSGVSFLRERLSGTLERILVSPTKRLELVLGYILGFGFYATIQTIIIQTFMIEVLGTPAAGSFLDILVVNLALVLAALSLGSLVSAFARNEFQVFQFIPLVILPQILFSGIFDLREAPEWVRILGRFFPLTYAGEALRDVMIRGKGLSDILLPLAVVIGFAVLFIGLNSMILRRGKA